MNLVEFDFRYDWAYLVLNALKSGFEVLRKKSGDDLWFDGIWQNENAETIYGIAYVLSQAYILGVVEDVNKMRVDKGKEKLSKLVCYSDDPQRLQNGVSRISLINSLANYYKHHDEWAKWPSNSTTQTLTNVGIFESTEFPCCYATTLLWDKEDLENLENLLLIISKWRKYIISKYL